MENGITCFMPGPKMAVIVINNGKDIGRLVHGGVLETSGAGVPLLTLTTFATGPSNHATSTSHRLANTSVAVAVRKTMRRGAV